MIEAKEGRVIFVGIHNKPGMMPLDSLTMTGKVIDKIISELKMDCVKTNLCDVDYFPTDYKEVNQLALEWHQWNKPTQQDIIVLLGQFVKTNFWYDNLNTVTLKHPAGIFRRLKTEEYVKASVEKILKAQTDLTFTK